jgi:hypothetical protein
VLDNNLNNFCSPYFITLYCIVDIFGPKRDEMTGRWRKLHNEELRGLYSSPSIVRVIKARKMRWAGHVARMGEVRGAYNILVGRPEGRRSYMLPYLLPFPPLCSPCLLPLTDIKRTDSPGLLYISPLKIYIAKRSEVLVVGRRHLYQSFPVLHRLGCCI